MAFVLGDSNSGPENSAWNELCLGFCSPGAWGHYEGFLPPVLLSWDEEKTLMGLSRE